MILTPVDRTDLPAILRALDEQLAEHPLARAVFRRITAEMPEGCLLTLSTDPAHHAQAVALCERFGLDILDATPQSHYSWDGRAVAIRTEPSVLIHEVAHYQCCAPDRRAVLDFGLGAGPETGRKAEADAVQTIRAVELDIEEALTSLLGILWEAELGQPALLAFLEQNWLEGGARPETKAHFLKMVQLLDDHALIDADGRPTMALRQTDDATFFAPWRS